MILWPVRPFCWSSLKPKQGSGSIGFSLVSCRPTAAPICVGRLTPSASRSTGSASRPAHQCGPTRAHRAAGDSAGGAAPENIPLDILYEDEWLAAINKPPGMVVHPAKGHWAGTLTSALQFHFDTLSGAGGPTRPGIVHRLDRDTSGVFVVAKTDRAHFALADQFEQRTVEKEYFALVCGNPDRDRDLIDLPIGVHPYQREKMAIRRDHPTSRPAQRSTKSSSDSRALQRFALMPKTGRTHQIRVHLSSIGCPVLCDRYYGGRTVLTRGRSSR